LLLPVGDDNTQRISFPVVTLILIAINVYVFYLEMTHGEQWVIQYSVVPADLLSGRQSWLALITSMFMHGGFAHIFGNMLYLYIFGDNVEDNLGRGKYILFYFLCGLGAMIAQVMVHPESTTPSLGASGAISGVLASYLILFPRNRVRVMIFFPFIITMTAWVVLGLWIATQLLSGYTDVFRHAATEEGGVAYMAHIGGFCTGILLTFIFRKRQATRGVAERLGTKADS
jgi:membrane associated rhomboid family serine protease